ncbi:site-specific integrase [Halorubrum sp. CGM5_25_10-8B]|uniref:site-specific integrase n=1 Tax=Halorubrum sp. CGM5_25_10-8B TaxID=2518115 RepID=UPI0010FA039C|nr:site-specific integrase [Halorubrum sp. CGM5_25_10-8B]TKX38015.1 site-specific integrase [Halorubrum sp. CGM5_25_10-8B]
MRLENYENQDGYRIVLSEKEREKLSDEVEETDSRIGWKLASQCGLRRQEIEHVRFKDIKKRDTGDWVLRVWEDGAKRSKYRETPVPSELAVQINTIAETVAEQESDEVISSSMRTVSRHIQAAAEGFSDEGWNYISLHDGRRTWANALLDDDVSPLQVMMWGGWDDWQTFRDHYLQDFSEEHQSEEIAKVDWI